MHTKHKDHQLVPTCDLVCSLNGAYLSTALTTSCRLLRLYCTDTSCKLNSCSRCTLWLSFGTTPADVFLVATSLDSSASALSFLQKMHLGRTITSSQSAALPWSETILLLERLQTNRNGCIILIVTKQLELYFDTLPCVYSWPLAACWAGWSFRRYS